MRRGRLRRYGGQANHCIRRGYCRCAYGRGLRSAFEPIRYCAGFHGAGNSREQQCSWHRRTHAPLRSTRGHGPRRGGSVRSLVPRPTRSTPSSQGIPLPRRPAVTVGRAHQGAHRRPARPRRHRYLPDATGTVDPSAWDHHEPTSSSHRSLTPPTARRRRGRDWLTGGGWRRCSADGRAATGSGSKASPGTSGSVVNREASCVQRGSSAGAVELDLPE